MDSVGAALTRLCDPVAEVSAHYLISELGGIYQLVAEDKRAWHAGSGSWGGVTDVNSHSIGIELANTGSTPFSEPQMSALETMLSAIMQRYGIAPESVIGHSDMAPDRKFDPGHRFDWHRLARQGISVWPEPELTSNEEQTFADAAHAFGYPTDPDETCVLRAFRFRFRPWAKGQLEHDDLAQIQNLARRFAVDRTCQTS